MVAGLNTDVKCLGVAFHVQTEDLGRRRPKIQTVVFHGGTAVAKIETSYAGLDLTPEELEDRLEAQHRRLVKELRAGRLDLAGGPSVASEPPRRVEPTRPAPRLTVIRSREPVRPASAPPKLPRPNAPAAVACPLHPAAPPDLAVPEPVEAPRPAGPRRMRRRRFDSLRLVIDPGPRSMWLAATFAVASWGAVILSFQSARGLSTEWNTVSAGMAPAPVVRTAAAPPVVEPSVDPVTYPVSEVPLDPAPLPKEEIAVVVPPTPEPKRRPPRPAPKRPEPIVEVARFEPPPPVAEPRVRQDPEPPLETEPPPALVEAVLEQATPPPVVRPGQLMDLAAVDVLPRPVKRELPTYTKRGKRKKQQGRVAVELLVDEIGRVAELRLREAIPDSDLNDNVIESVWHWRFAPATKSGVPVQVWKPVAVDFSIVSGQTRVQITE